MEYKNIEVVACYFAANDAMEAAQKEHELREEIERLTTELEQARETLFKRDEYQESLEVTFSKQVAQLESERDRYKESYEGQLRNTIAFMKEKENAEAEIELFHARIQELEAKLQEKEAIIQGAFK